MSAVERGAPAADGPTAPRPGGPGGAGALPSAARSGRPGAWVSAAATVAVGALLFGAALNDGSYALQARAAVAVALWWAIALCVGLGLWPRDRLPRAALAAGALLLAFGAWTGLSALWAPAAQTALDELVRVSVYVAIFSVAVLATRRGDAPAWTDGLGLGIAAVAVLSLLSRCFPDLVGTDELRTLLPASFPQRLTYPLQYWNGLGIFAGLGVAPLVRAATAERLAAWRGLALAPFPVIAGVVYLTSSRGGVVVAVAGALVFLALAPRRLLTIGALAVATAGSGAAVAVLHARRALVEGPLDGATAASQGRSAALLILVLCIAVGVVWGVIAATAPRSVRVAPPVRWAAWALVGLAAVVIVVAANPSERIDTFKQPPADSLPGQQSKGYVAAHLTSGGGAGRWQFWSSAVDEFQDQPLRGGGAGSFESWWAQHGSITYFVRDAHSLWLETLGELGVIGLALLGGAFLAALAVGLARLRTAVSDGRGAVAALAGVVVAFAVGAAIDWTWELTAVGAVALIGLGLLSGPATLPVADADAATPAASAPRRRGLPVVPRVAVVVGALLLLAFAGIVVLGESRLDSSRAAAERADTKGALDDARGARALEPWSSDPPLQLALVEERTGDVRDARGWIGRAIGKDGSDWRLWLVAARLDTKLGDVAAARRDLARARALNPRSPIFTQG